MSKVKVNEASLEALRLPELQAMYAESLGEPTRTPNKAWLVRKILEATKARAATIDRLVHHAVIIEMTGPSVRADEAEQARKETATTTTETTTTTKTKQSTKEVDGEV